MTNIKPGKTKQCKNCSAHFDGNNTRLEVNTKYNLRWCSNCAAVNSFKKYIYNLTIKTPALSTLLMKYVAIKRRLSRLKDETIGNAFFQTAPLLRPEVESYAAANNICMGEAISLLIRANRFQNTVRQDVAQGNLYNELNNAGFFKHIANNKSAIPTNEQLFDLLISQDPEYLSKVPTNSDLTEFKSGHYNVSPGNCAKKVATRIWRALRFLSNCNQQVLARYPDSPHLLELNYNKDVTVSQIMGRIMTSSRGKVWKVFQDSLQVDQQQPAQTNGLKLEKYFCISINRKETKYWIPTIAQPPPPKKDNDTTPVQPTFKTKSRKLFIQDYVDNRVEHKKLQAKTFDYLAVMSVQNSDKVADVLKKMGDNIWLANVYTLNVPRTKNELKRKNSQFIRPTQQTKTAAGGRTKRQKIKK